MGEVERVVFVYDKPKQRQSIYVNGQEVKSCTGKPPFTDASEVRLGEWGAPGQNEWQGEISDAKIFRKAFALPELQAMFPAPDVWFAPPSCAVGTAGAATTCTNAVDGDTSTYYEMLPATVGDLASLGSAHLGPHNNVMTLSNRYAKQFQDSQHTI